MRLRLGAPVICSDKVFGELADVVIDPAVRHVTHLVVQPRHHHGLARLVPVDLASLGPGHAEEVWLRRTAGEIRQLEPVQEFAFLPFGQRPVQAPDWDIGIEDILVFPDDDGTGLGTCWLAEPMYESSYDRIPKGDVELRRTSTVNSADEHVLGRVDGFLVDADSLITHLLLRRGHLWRRREVTIPIGSVAKLATDSVTLTLTHHEVAALAPVRSSSAAGVRVLRRSADAA